MSDKPKKGKQGFASNPNLINRGGRPKGSRNKTSLTKAQLRLDKVAETAVETLYALMVNDKKKLGIKDDVPLSIRRDASKEVLNKAIANEKDKQPVVDKQKTEEVKVKKPLFSATPVKKVVNEEN